MIETFVKQAQILPGEFGQDVSLQRYNSWRVGGAGEFVYRPKALSDLQQFLQLVPDKLPIMWLGLGSNTLIRDGGIPGVVVITQGALSQIDSVDETHIDVEAGVSCAQVARFSARNHLTGAEFLAGVPGTMGGALAMNAGCYGSETWSYVESVQLLDRHGLMKTKTADEFEIGYRSVKGQGEAWFVRARLALAPGDKTTGLATIREMLDQRAASQPTSDHSCGSVFRNPPGDYSGRLIEACGLKGHQLGGAQVSDKHANFIVNAGDATARDIEDLISMVHATVAAAHGIDLVREVKIMGEA